MMHGMLFVVHGRSTVFSSVLINVERNVMVYMKSLCCCFYNGYYVSQLSHVRYDVGVKSKCA